MTRDRVFISYSRDDKEWLERLQILLRPWARESRISVWADTEIQPGADWRKEIKGALAQARVAVLLVSPKFLASDFIAEQELPKLLDQEDVKILWVHVRPCAYTDTAIVRYQAAHDPTESLVELSPARRDRILLEISEEVKKAVAEAERQAEEEERRRQAEVRRRQAAKEERRRQAAEEERRRQAAEEERRRQAEAAAQRRAELEERRRAEERRRREVEATSERPKAEPLRLDEEGLPVLERAAAASASPLKRLAPWIVVAGVAVTVWVVALSWLRPSPPAPAATLRALPEVIERGGSATLVWTTTGASDVRIDPWPGDASAKGSLEVSPKRTTIYRLLVKGAGGETDATAKITVAPLRAGETFQDCDGCPEMVIAPAGTFIMGSPESEPDRDPDEGPQREVKIAREFALGKYEVTRAEFAVFVRESGHDPQDCDYWTGSDWQKIESASWRDPGFGQTEDHPVVCVSWQDARKYVEWLREKTGEDYHLPSESQWEYAARAGTANSRYWGDDSRSACDHANVADSTTKAEYPKWEFEHECTDQAVHTASRGSYGENTFGFADILGNVWEWTEDCRSVSYSGAPSDGAAWTARECALRVARGGSWDSSPKYVRSASRLGIDPTIRYPFLGFRVGSVLP